MQGNQQWEQAIFGKIIKNISFISQMYNIFNFSSLAFYKVSQVGTNIESIRTSTGFYKYPHLKDINFQTVITLMKKNNNLSL